VTKLLFLLGDPEEKWKAIDVPSKVGPNSRQAQK